MTSWTRPTRTLAGVAAAAGALLIAGLPTTAAPASAAPRAAAQSEEFSVAANAYPDPKTNFAAANVLIHGKVTFDGTGAFTITGTNKTECVAGTPSLSGTLHWKTLPSGTEHTDKLDCKSYASWKTVTKDLNDTDNLNGNDSVELWACIDSTSPGGECGQFTDTVVPGKSVSGIKDKEVPDPENQDDKETATVTYKAAAALTSTSYKLVGELSLTGTLEQDPELPGSAAGSGATCAGTKISGATLYWQALPGGTQQSESLPCSALNKGELRVAPDSAESVHAISATGPLTEGQHLEVWGCLDPATATDAPVCTEHSTATAP